MLKKLFGTKKEDICPNCGVGCFATDILCPNCGKNLDDLFEQLPDSEVTYNAHLIAKTLLNPQLIKVWNLTNSSVLIMSLLTPWVIFFSDISIKLQLQYVIGLKVLLSPVLAMIYNQIFPLGQFLSIFGLSLIDAIAPAVALHYSFHGIRTVFNLKTKESTPTLKYILAIIRMLLAAISLAQFGFGTGFNSYLSLGYILVIIGLSSSFFLELISPVLGYKQINNEAA